MSHVPFLYHISALVFSAEIMRLGVGGMVSYSPKKRAWKAVGAVAYPSSERSQRCMGIPCKIKWKRQRYPHAPVCPAIPSGSTFVPSHFRWQLASHTRNTDFYRLPVQLP